MIAPAVPSIPRANPWHDLITRDLAIQAALQPAAPTPPVTTPTTPQPATDNTSTSGTNTGTVTDPTTALLQAYQQLATLGASGAGTGATIPTDPYAGLGIEAPVSLDQGRSSAPSSTSPIIGLLVIAGLGVGGYLAYKHFRKK